MRVVSWNVNYRTRASEAQGQLLSSLRPAPDLVMIQEANPGSVEVLRVAAGFDWAILGQPGPSDLTPKGKTDIRSSAILGRGDVEIVSLPELPVSRRVASARVLVDRSAVLAVSYHAPPGVNWGRVKADQAVAIARWLAQSTGPIVMGADANTPDVDGVDFAHTRTHWATGHPRLGGDPGDDVLWGPGVIHGLRDVLRTHLATRPDELNAIRRERPCGPLAISVYTGLGAKRVKSARRYDSVWATDGLAVLNVAYRLDDQVRGLTDHAMVIADLSCPNTPSLSGRSERKAAQVPRPAPSPLPVPQEPLVPSRGGTTSAGAATPAVHGRARGTDGGKVRVELSGLALATVGITAADLMAAAVPSSEAGFHTVVLGAAATRYVRERCSVDLRDFGPDQPLPVDAALLIAAGIPCAAAWVRYDEARGVRIDRSIYCGDLARAVGDDPFAATKRCRASAGNRREGAPPRP